MLGAALVAKAARVASVLEFLQARQAVCCIAKGAGLREMRRRPMARGDPPVALTPGGTPARAHPASRVAALAEQAMISGANFVAFLLFARFLPQATWGEFGFAYALAVFAQGFQRAWVTIPMISFSAAAGRWAQEQATWSRLNSMLALIVVGLFGLGAGAAVLFGVAWVGRATAMAAVMAAPMLLYEYGRRAVVLETRMGLLAAMGLIYALALTAIAAVGLRRELHGWLPAVAVTIAASSAYLIFLWRTRRRTAGDPARLSFLRQPSFIEFVRWASLSHLGFSGYNFGVQTLLGALAGPSALGIFHACRAFLQPVSVAIGAMDTVDKPRAAAALGSGGASAMRQALFRSLRAIAVIALPYVALVACFAEPLLAWVYKDRYAGQSSSVLAWCVVALGMIVAQPVESGLYVARMTRQMFFGRAFAAAISLLVAWLSISAWGVPGAVLAVALGYSVTAVAGLFLLARVRHVVDG